MEQILGHTDSNLILYSICKNTLNPTQTSKRSSHDILWKKPEDRKGSNTKELEGTMKGLVENKHISSVFQREFLDLLQMLQKNGLVQGWAMAGLP